MRKNISFCCCKMEKRAALFQKKLKNFSRAKLLSSHHTQKRKRGRALSNNEKKKAYFISANHALAQKKEREIEMNEE